MASKSILLSKTFWVNVLALVGVIVGAFVPSVGDFIKNYFAEMGSAWALVNVALRLISKDKLYLY